MTPRSTNLPLPTPQQLAWHRLEFYGFIHFTTNTFTGREWGYGDESPELFAPTELSTDQWAQVAKDAGMQGLILTCKHHDGFCLWPSKHTEHSVKNSLYKNGTGDVVRELSDSCRRYGLKFGVYLSPWDRNHPNYGHSQYIDYYRSQLTELLTEYGPVFEVWLDGANGGDGFYGGANEVRTIERSTYYQWPETTAHIRALQPNAVIFSDAGPDIRWIGNERGIASPTTWYTLDTQGRYPGYSPPGYDPEEDLGPGHPHGLQWVPPEADVSIRPGWFYHREEDDQVKDGLQLLDLYYKSVGRGANLLLNLPPDQRGLIPERDIRALQEFRRLREQLDRNHLTSDALVTVSSGSNCTAVLNDDLDQLWQADLNDRNPWLQLDFANPVTFDHIILQEAIQCGQRIAGWQLETAVSDDWQVIATGTTVGHKRIIPLPSLLRARKLRLRFTGAHPGIAVNHLRLASTQN